MIDLRTLMPFDIDTHPRVGQEDRARGDRRTRRRKTCGFGAELVASIQEQAILHLEAPILRVTGFDTPFPYTLEHEYLPDADRVLDAVETRW